MDQYPTSLAGRLPRATRWSLVGLLVGVVGLVVQAIADPGKFTEAQGAFGGIPFPPGILFILAAGLLTVATSRWRWHPVFAVLTGVWIVGVGALAGFLLPNLTSANPGTVVGNVVMSVGLTGAAVLGVIAMVTPGRRAVGAEAGRP
jgi:hypothetical protein